MNRSTWICELKMTDIFYDTETSIVSESYAIVYAPRKNRKRFPQNCVSIVASLEAAVKGVDKEKNLFPAKVLGPSRSSEGLMLYYLVEWIDATAQD
jgi:hypothetical protein